MIRADKKYSIEEVFSKLPTCIKEGRWEMSMPRADFDGDSIKVATHLLQTFYIKGTKCVGCGLEGQYFAKEKRHPKHKYHLNLYGIDENDNEVIFTKDHIYPKSKGDRDNINNYQTMCKKCNSEKKDKIIDSGEIL